METVIDINVDMGESFGRYVLGNDGEVMKYISSANVACGFHAGDPRVMRTTVRLAKKNKVEVGAHPGLPDLMGFGRRTMNITPEELRDYVVYQVGALKAFVEAEDLKLQHVKPHGALYAMVEREESLAEAIIDAILEIDTELIFLTEYNTIAYKLAKEKGLKVVPEGFPDLKYDSGGHWVIEREKKPWNPDDVAKRALMIAKENKIETIDGKIIPLIAKTICLHGDSPNSVEVAKTVRDYLIKNDIGIIPLREII